MRHKTIRTAIVAGLVGVAAMFTVANAEAQGYDYHEEVERSPLQYCYPEYDRYAGRDRIKQYTGYCFAGFNSFGDPLYLYKEFRYCEVERRSKGILSYTRIDCGRNRVERVRHPYYRPPPRNYGHGYFPPYRDRDYDRYDRYDRDHHNRRDQPRHRDHERGPDLRDRRRDLLRKQRERRRDNNSHRPD